MTELRTPGAKSTGRAEVRALLGTLDSALAYGRSFTTFCRPDFPSIRFKDAFSADLCRHFSGRV